MADSTKVVLQGAHLGGTGSIGMLVTTDREEIGPRQDPFLKEWKHQHRQAREDCSCTRVFLVPFGEGPQKVSTFKSARGWGAELNIVFKCIRFL